MKLCILGDVHIGARNDSIAFHNYFERFFSEVLFPYLKDNNINTIVQLGDLFDRRKYTNSVSLYKSKKYFFDVIDKSGIEMHVIIGNHDTALKNVNDVNTPSMLLEGYSTIYTYSEPTDITFDSTSIALLPWVCSGNYDESVSFINNTKSQILMGHLELSGFEMYRGVFHDHGTVDVKLFDKFDMVLSGHFHHKSSKNNIHYVGTPYELSWSDYNDPRGFHILDTETRELTFIRNPIVMFNKIHYDDNVLSLEDINSLDFSAYKNSYVKVIVRNKSNPYWFDLFIDKLEKFNALDIQVVDDHLNLDLEDDDTIIDEAEDTLSILRKVVDNIETQVPRKDIDIFLSSLYNEALHLD